MGKAQTANPRRAVADNMTNKLFEVLHEDADLLVVNKPAGLVCHPTKTDEYSSLISRARLYLGKESHPHLVNRLDRETSGVTVLAKNDEAALALRRIWESRQVEKEYLAIVHGHLRESTGIIDQPLGKDEQSRVVIKDRVRPDGAPARTDYHVERHFSRAIPASYREPSTCNFQPATQNDPQPFSFLKVHPHTGRKHQIRIHLAHLGHPIVGDKLYGGDEDFYLALVENRLTTEQRLRLILPHHALHASELRFVWRGQAQVFRAEPEPWFVQFLDST
jgi:23S rRNA pseudouridine1911/1915/1917 synthase